MPYESPDLRNVTRPGGIALYIDAGSGYLHLGNMDISQVAEESKTDELEIGSQVSGEFRTAQIIPIKRIIAYKIKLQEITGINLQAYLGGGDLNIVNPGTDTVIDQPIVLNGVVFHSVGRYGISEVTLKNSETQTMILNTDYIIDPGSASGLMIGRVARLSGGNIADGEQCTISYTYTTWDSITFPVATGGYTPVAARLDMLTNYGTQMRRYIHKCLLKPDGALSFDGKKELQIPLTLQVLADYLNNPTNPYGYAEIIEIIDG